MEKLLRFSRNLLAVYFLLLVASPVSAWKTKDPTNPLDLKTFSQMRMRVSETPAEASEIRGFVSYIQQDVLV